MGYNPPAIMNTPQGRRLLRPSLMSEADYGGT